MPEENKQKIKKHQKKKKKKSQCKKNGFIKILF